MADKTFSITVNAAQAKMLLELCTRGTVAGPDAATLAELYAKAQAAARATADNAA